MAETLLFASLNVHKTTLNRRNILILHVYYLNSGFKWSWDDGRIIYPLEYVSGWYLHTVYSVYSVSIQCVQCTYSTCMGRAPVLFISFKIGTASVLMTVSPNQDLNLVNPATACYHGNISQFMTMCRSHGDRWSELWRDRLVTVYLSPREVEAPTYSSTRPWDPCKSLSVAKSIGTVVWNWLMPSVYLWNMHFWPKDEY